MENNISQLSIKKKINFYANHIKNVTVLLLLSNFQNIIINNFIELL